MSTSRFMSPALSPSASVLPRSMRQLFGAMVQDRREILGRTADEAAWLAGMEASEWLAVEAGHIPADPARLRAMAAALEIRFDQMAMLVYLCQEAWQL